MSRRRRDRGDAPDDLLSELEDNEAGNSSSPVTASSIADEAYGSTVGTDDPFAQLNRERIRIVPRSIESIVPDPSQPRRVIPYAVRHYWNGNADARSVRYLIEMWLKEAEIERGEPLPLDEIIAGEETDRAIDREASGELPRIGSDTAGPLEAGLMRVVELAASINRDGLTNPITIVARKNGYVIETGERRWLAYHLLHWRSNDAEKWSKIPARVVNELSIWRQASENNARADLNAIGKARQFALLLMDLYRERGEKFKPISRFDSDQDFYAQVADGNDYPVPRNSGEMLLNAMGLKNAVQLRQYRALLRAPEDLWAHADDHNLTEGEVRKLMQQDDSVTRVTVSRSALDNFQSNALESVRKQWQKLNKRERQKALAALRDLLATLEQDV